MPKISVVINSFNEEKNIGRALDSVQWADEIVLCDMHSEDKTVEIAKRYGAKIFFHEKTDYVEPARNFAISKAAGDWILLLDADEEVPNSLAEKLKDLVENEENISFVNIPRKNIIFGKWMKASMWWPDYHTRFFRKGSVKWNNQIHSKPETLGESLTLPDNEELAICHRNYQTIFQYIERLNRYSAIEAGELQKNKVAFRWHDLIEKPLNEFLGRFFANRGYEDGLHGLALSLLQAFSFLIVYLKLWETGKFSEEKIKAADFNRYLAKAGKDVGYWMKYGNLSKNPVKKILQKVRNKLLG